ncbi:uncharacterized protein [Trachinotus anak]|uniref:uncharacterized protein isoform X3 n=1 Tax=Trachinotus anak TaxID=443729 RepID=UPI0039F1B5C4
MDHAGDVNYITGRPAEDGLPEVIRIEDDAEDNDLPGYVSSSEEDNELEEGEFIDDEEDWSDGISIDSGRGICTQEAKR